MKVKDCMCNSVVWLTPEASVCDCAKLMCQEHIGSIPVCDNDQNVIGFVTDRDILLRTVACNKDINTTKLSDIMSTGICCCDINNDVEHATKLMSENKIRRIPVVENNKIVGMLTLGDLAKNQDISTGEVAATFENICNCNTKNAE